MIKAAAKLGYQPGRRGDAPLSRASTIGFICDEISTDPWTSIGFDGVREKAWERGLTVTVAVTRGDVDMEAAALEQLASQPLFGLIFATVNTRLVHLPATLPQTPTVLLNCHVANRALPSVVPSEVAGGHAATNFLLQAGHRRIGYINGEPSMEASQQRLRGYRRALSSADLPFDPGLVRNGNWQPISGYEGARALMLLPSRPTAIFCANDLMAMGALLAAVRPAAHDRAYDLPGGETLTYRQMAERVFEGMGRRPRIVTAPEWLWALGFAIAKPLLKGATAQMGKRMAENLVFKAGPAQEDLSWAPRDFQPKFAKRN